MSLSLSLSPHSSNSHYEHLTISTLDANPHIVVVALDRPRKRNAITSKMWKEIGRAFRSIGSTGDGTRCVLLIGAGAGFCGGIDITDENFGFASMDTEGQNDDDDGESEVDVARKYMAFRPKILEMQSCLTAVEECHVPVVCAIHGVCIGAGIDLSSCADVRICSKNAIFSVREARIGLAADVGTLQRLPIICGGHGSRIRELCLTGEDFDAAEAARLGFVSRIAPSNVNGDGNEDGDDYLKVGVKICQLIARNSPVAVHATKLSLNYSRDHTVKEGLEHIASHNAAALMTRDIGASFLAATTGKRKGGHEPAAA
eukprot:186510_1